MALLNLIQPAFTQGEWGDSAHGRVDIDKASIAAKTILNWTVHPEGGISTRGGLEYICEVKDSSKTVRLIEFQYNDTDTYVMEFGDQYIRFVRNGGQVISASLPYEISTPYLEAELFDLKFTQSADVMTITHPNHAPRELSRTGHTSWTLSTISFAPQISTPTGGSGTPATSGSETYNYRITAIAEETVEESLPHTITVSSAAVLSSTDYIDLSWSSVTGAELYNVYREKNGLYGFIGTTEATSFKDDNIAPDLDDTPPKQRTLFNASGDYPEAPAYYQQRRVFGSSLNDPIKLWTTQTGNYYNVNVSTPLKDTDAITLQLTARRVNKIRHVLPMDDLVLMTSGAIWRLVETDNVLSAANPPDIRIQEEHGVSNIPPLVVGDTALYVQDKGQIIRDLKYTFDSDKYGGSDINILAKHRSKRRSTVDWAYGESPGYLIFAAHDDGSFSGLTFVPEYNVQAWHSHDTDGKVESVANVSESTEDVFYFLVNRTINGATKRYIERMHTRQIDDVEDYFGVDCGLSYDGRDQAVALTLSSAAVGTGVTVTAGSSLFASTHVGGKILGDDGGVAVITAYTSATEVTAEITTAFGSTSVASGAWDLALKTFTNLSHVEAKEVAILGDGNSFPRATVASGQVTVPQAVTRCHIGLPYNCDFEPLDWEVGAQNGSTTGKPKVVSKVHVRVKESRGLQIGYDAATLTEMKDATPDDFNPIALKTGVLSQNITAEWRKTGSILFRVKDPLPATILSITPEVNVGGI